MKTVATKAGPSFLVDDEDFDMLSQYAWYVTPNGGYAYTVLNDGGKRRSLRMQRMIMNPPDDKVVDHINGDVTDNRKSNLRLATRAENARNTAPRSDRPGARRSGKKWAAIICVNRKVIRLGLFSTAEEASKTYLEATKTFHGEFAMAHRI